MIWKKNILNIELVISWILLVFMAIFMVSEIFSDTMLLPKWYLSEVAIVICGTVIFITFILNYKNNEYRNIFIILETVVLTLCTLQAALMLIQKIGIIKNYGEFTCGSFDNPAGFASCISFSWPLGLHGLRNQVKRKRFLLLLSKSICLLSIIMSGSRTGLICILFISLWLLFRKREKHRLLFITLLMTVFVSLAFIIKKDSTSGRWFICQRTVELINKRPLLGWGSNGFEQQYMNMQGYYFEHHPTEKYTMLADGIKHPLNEYLNIAVNYGLLGVLLLVVVIFVIFWYYNRHPSEISEVGFCTLLSIVLFSMFSYPFSYPFTWIMCFFSLCAIFHKDLLSIVIRIKYRRYFCMAFLLCFVSITPGLFSKISNDIKWKKISEYAKYGVSEKMMPRYDNLYLRMRNNPYFLYNYAAEEYDAGRYRDALARAKECQHFFLDYDLEMLMADCYQGLNDTQMAIYHYHKAHYMIPSRLMPYYGEFDVYRQCNDKINSRRMAYLILGLPVKVRSYSTKRIKDEVKLYIISEINYLNK